MRETRFRDRVVRHCKGRGWLTASLTGNASWPDLLVVPRGRPPFFVELKADRDGSYGERPLQTVMRCRLREMGHVSLLLDPHDDWEAELDNRDPVLH